MFEKMALFYERHTEFCDQLFTIVTVVFVATAFLIVVYLVGVGMTAAF